MKDGRLFLGGIDMNKFDIFPTPIATSNIPVSKNLINYFKTVETNPLFNGQNGTAVSYGTHSKSTNILREKGCENFRRLVIDEVNKFARDVLCIETETMLDVCSWVSIKTPGQEHITHSHPNSIITAVFYIDEVYSECPIFFAKQARGNSLYEIRPRINQEMLERSLYSEAVYFSPKQFDLLMFPSYLPHGVPRNTTKKARYSISCNFMTANESGMRENLTYFPYTNAII